MGKKNVKYFKLGIFVFLLMYSIKNHYMDKIENWYMSPYLFISIVAIFNIYINIKEIKLDSSSLEKKIDMEINSEVIKVFISLLIYILMFMSISFLFSTFIFIIIYLFFMEELNLKNISILSTFTIFIYLLFNLVLQVNLP